MTQTTQTLTDYVAKADKQQIARCGDMPESTSTEVGRWRFLYGNCQFLQDCGINDACLPSYCSHSERGHRSYFFMKGRKNTTTTNHTNFHEIQWYHYRHWLFQMFLTCSNDS